MYVFWHMSHTRLDMLPQKLSLDLNESRRLISGCRIPPSLRIHIFMAHVTNGDNSTVTQFYQNLNTPNYFRLNSTPENVQDQLAL